MSKEDLKAKGSELLRRVVEGIERQEIYRADLEPGITRFLSLIDQQEQGKAKPPTTLREMWAENIAWSKANFPDREWRDVIEHIQEELIELKAARIAYDTQAFILTGGVPELTEQSAISKALYDMVKEAADIGILAGQFITMLGFDPETEILRKWAEVLERTYIDGERVV